MIGIFLASSLYLYSMHSSSNLPELNIPIYVHDSSLIQIITEAGDDCGLMYFTAEFAIQADIGTRRVIRKQRSVVSILDVYVLT